jgi:arginine exporter protein ArgO
MGLITDIAYLRGIIAGFALAAPLGPVAVLCIRRALALGRLQCALAGIGAAAADTVFGAVAGLGITFISDFVIAHEALIGLLGGAIVLGTGIVTYRTRVCAVTGEVQVQSLRRDMLAAFTMAIPNPATMLGAAGIFAAFGPISLKAEPIKAFWLVFGVFCGSMLWWTILGITAGTFKDRFVDGGLRRLNKISGAVIGVCGGAVLATVIYRILK